jgi:uncharacterized protein YndB with AHSA1/START domain
MSPTVVESVTIEVPTERVWEKVMDARCLDEWVTTHHSVEGAVSGAAKEGTTFTQRLKLAGTRFKVRWRIVEADAPRLARWEGEGPGGSSARVVYRLAEENGGTRFDYENCYELPGGMLGKAAGKVLSTAPARREARRSLANLKALLESDRDGA